jgi:hypothetical protein
VRLRAVLRARGCVHVRPRYNAVPVRRSVRRQCQQRWQRQRDSGRRALPRVQQAVHQLPQQHLVAFSQLALIAPATLYPGQAMSLGSSGLQMYSATLGTSINVSYSSATSQYVDSYGTAFSLFGTVITSTFSVTAVGSSGVVVQSCTSSTCPARSVPPCLLVPPALRDSLRCRSG